MRGARLKIIFLFVSTIILSNCMFAQGISNFSQAIKDFKSQYAVPDAPAYNILNVSPSNIMKPGSVTDLALGLSDFIGENASVTLPQSFSMEFSPGFLFFGKNLSLTEYQNNSWLYRLRLSVATNRNDYQSTATSLGVGLRITLSDESDFRNNPDYIKDATNTALAISEIISAAQDSLENIRDSLIALKKTMKPKVDSLIALGILPARDITIPPKYTVDDIKNMPEIKSQIDKAMQPYNLKWSQENWTKKNWNADISEIAVAVKTTSKDSLASNLKFSKVSFWYSAAYKISDWGQFLFGAYGNYEKDIIQDEFIGSGSLGMRFYAGTNSMKIYLETQGSVIQDKNPEWLLNSGLELKIQNNIWAEFTAGLKTGNESENGKLVTDFKLKYGI